MSAGVKGVTIVFTNDPEFEDGLEILDVHVHRHGRRGRKHEPYYDPMSTHLALSDEAWVREHIANGFGLKETIFGEDKLPPEVAESKKFLVHGMLVADGGYWHGSEYDDYEEYFEVEEMRVLEVV